MKKIILLPLAGAALLGLSACGKSANETAAANDTATLNYDEGADLNSTGDLNASTVTLNETETNISADASGNSSVGNDAEATGNAH